MKGEQKKGTKSSLDGTGKFLKYSIFVVNLVLFVGGIVVLALAVWILADGSRDALGQMINTNNGVPPAALLLTFGAVTAVISFLGCCGAIKEVKCLLITFFIIIMVITILMIIGVVLLSRFKNQAKNVLVEKLRESMDYYKSDRSIRNAWNYVQRTLKCCGLHKPDDWYWEIGRIPESCNCNTVDDCIVPDYSIQTYWYQGCVEKIEDYLKRISTPLIAVVAVMIAVLFLTMVFTCALYFKLK